MSFLARPVRQAYVWFERALAIVLVATLMVVLTWSSFHFVRTIGSQMWAVGTGRADHVELHHLLARMDLLREVLGGFLLLLIGLELMKTVVLYLDEHVLHWEVVFPVALIALARHALEVDLADTSPLAMGGLGVVILALAASFYLLRRSHPVA